MDDAAPGRRDTEAEAFAAAPWLAEAEAMLDSDPRGFGDTGRKLIDTVARVDQSVPVSIAWCGLFVAHCLRKARPDLDLPMNQPQGRPWQDFGEPCEPQLGAILVFWRFSPHLPFGHAGFYWAEDETAFHVLGGNQHDRITIGRAEKCRLLSARWPDDSPRTGLRRRRKPEDAGPLGEKGR